MKRILTAVVLIPLVLLVVLKAPNWLFPLAVGAFALIAAYEYLNILGHYGLKPMKWLTMAIVAMLFLGWATALSLHPIGSVDANRLPQGVVGTAIKALVYSSPLLLLIAAMRRPDFAKALPEAASSALAIPYIALTLGSLIAVRISDGGIFLLLYLFSMVWSGDIFAYYVGRALGKHKLAPRISPGKTWEGTAASLVGSVAVGVLLFQFKVDITSALLRWNLLNAETRPYLPEGSGGFAVAILLSLAVNIAAQAGDLLESMIKRGANLKDSGTLLPGHGGMLDRIDALLLATPVVYFYAMIGSNLFVQPILIR